MALISVSIQNLCYTTLRVRKVKVLTFFYHYFIINLVNPSEIRFLNQIILNQFFFFHNDDGVAQILHADFDPFCGIRLT